MGDFRKTVGESLPLTKKSVRRRRILWTLFVLSLISGIIYAGIAIKVERYALATGYVTTEKYAEVRPGTMGTVASVAKESGMRVEKDEVLVQLDDAEEQATLEEARQHAQKRQVDLKRREAEIANEIERRKVALEEQKRNHKDAINIARLQLKNAQTKLERTRELVENGLKAASALEDEQLKSALAQAQLSSLLARDLTIYDILLAKDRAAYDTELASMRQDLKAMRDAEKRLETRLRSKQVRAPIAGQVLRYEFVVGELVRPETVLFEIFGGTEQVLKLRIAERYATKVAEGQQYSAILAPYRGMNTIYFKGTVKHLRNVIQAEGRTTYRVAYCDFDSQGKTIPPGTTAEARVYYGEAGRSYLWYYLFNIDP
ncbi:MAG: HlyD family efflux transporter periplasmic adaptor subunit [Lentisphaeria bacterium]|nr:HlyD family efflux transporter periplasmic adaptor subunit [Lentisphaeria bacterium]